MNKFTEILAELHKKDRLLIVQDYDVYLLIGRERCRLWVRDDFVRVNAYTWHSEGPSYQIKSQIDEQMLKEIGGLFYHANYLPLITVPELVYGLDIKHDFNFGRNVLFELWNLIHPKNKASDKERNSFASQKLRVISVSKNERQVMHSLYRNEQPVVEQLDNAINNINRRWYYYTGRNLLKTTPNGKSQNIEIDF